MSLLNLIKVAEGDHEEKDDVYDCAQSVMEDGEDEDSAYAICQEEVGKESDIRRAFLKGFEKEAQNDSLSASATMSGVGALTGGSLGAGAGLVSATMDRNKVERTFNDRMRDLVRIKEHAQDQVQGLRNTDAPVRTVDRFKNRAQRAKKDINRLQDLSDTAKRTVKRIPFGRRALKYGGVGALGLGSLGYGLGKYLE